MTTRRDFIRNAGLITAAGIVASKLGNAMNFEPAITAAAPGVYPFVLPPLPYKYEDLEPNIDSLTMQIHHDKHHAAYVNKLNDALKDKAADVTSLELILKNVSNYSDAVRNNGGGHYNHSMFWEMMKPGGGGEPTGKLATAITSAFGSVADFKMKFYEAAMTRFGSGWAWLIKGEGKLKIISTANQDNPLMDTVETKGSPLLCLDVWEHAYYLKYQNKRADYVNNFWNVINWDAVAKRLG